ncbi:MAG: DUF4256 domain-containing protein [Bacteroidota bacterium]
MSEIKPTTKELKLLIDKLRDRFETNLNRHPSIDWKEIETFLAKNKKALLSIYHLEESGGEPDVVELSTIKGDIVFIDCSKETPVGRRSLCYDKEALDSRKENKPNGSATQMALDMGVTLLTEQEYFDLQKYGPFDMKTSTWLHTPDSIRKLGGAIFGDYKFERVFIYHNGAQSYYAVRGFRAKIKIN